MKYLLDVSVLVAWGLMEHNHNSIVSSWLMHERKKEHVLFLTSPITELGFVRIIDQLTKGEIATQEATKILQKMLQCLAPSHRFLPDDLPMGHWPDWCKTASRTTDAHLLLLAKKHGATLATLDKGIPGAFLVK